MVGLAHYRAGNLTKAEAEFKRAVALRPSDETALHLLAICVLKQGRPQRALQIMDKALACRPDNPELLHTTGSILQMLGRPEYATAFYHRLLDLDPDRPVTLSNLGNALREQGKLDEAHDCLERAVTLDPAFAKGWSNLALVEEQRGDRDAAVVALEHAVVLQPENAEFHYNLATALAAAGRRADAIAALERMLALEPGHAKARLKLSLAYRQDGDFARGRSELETALLHTPDDAEVRWSYGLSLLADGNYAPGWEEVEWRYRDPAYGAKPLAGHRWNGEALDGGTLVINHEQGLGDAIQFIRFATDAAARGARVVYRGPRSILPLIESLPGVSGTATQEDPPPEFDTWLPIMSLPLVLGFDSGPALSRSPYLRPDAVRVARWRDHLPTTAGLRIGIVWQGNSRYAQDRDRSIPLVRFEPLARIPGITLIALQKNHGAEQLGDWPKDVPLHDLAPLLDNDGAAFLDTLAVLPSLDLVITSDTAFAHLAGAAGIETWLPLALAPDWRWGLEGDRTVWYPTMRLFRQRHPGDWTGPFADMAAALRARLGLRA